VSAGPSAEGTVTIVTEREIDQLLNTLCVGYGFCLPAEAEHKLRTEMRGDAVAFTNAVFELEGLDPSTADRHLYRKLKAVVEAAFRAASFPPAALSDSVEEVR
jgi:hypothetical protein